jgi:hypothetical protein
MRSIVTVILVSLLLPAVAGAHRHHAPIHARVVKHGHRHARVGDAGIPIGAPNFGPQTPEEEALWRQGMAEQGFTPAEVSEIED